jgi:hypothetical protein
MAALTAGLPRGECIVTSLPGYGEDGSIPIRIDHADPRILISGELLDHIADHPDDTRRLDVATCHTYVGAVLRIDAVNRTVIYRITEFIPAVYGYIAEWPD